MNRNVTLFTVLSLFLLTASGTLHAREKGLDFVENKGQWVSDARFKAEVPGGAMFLTDKGFVYHYVDQTVFKQADELADKGKDVSRLPIHHHAYKVNFIGANAGITYLPSDKRSNYNNYFVGNDKSKWASHVGLYGKITGRNVYNGIDLAVYSKDDHSLKYDFNVAPGADPAQIVLSFEGVTPHLTAEGNIRVKTSVNEIIEKAPYSYQLINGQTISVKSRFRLKNGQISFEFPQGYNKQYPLVIDPDLVFATYSGGTGGDYYGHSTTYDEAGDMFVGALGDATGWPVTTGAYQTTFGGDMDVSINKYNAAGSNLIFSTYYGGSGCDIPNTLRVNSQNELVAVGSTTSSNLPVTTSAYSSSLGGSSDIFIAHFSEDGSALLGASYVGGSGADPSVFDIAYGTSVPTGLGSSSISPCEVIFDSSDNIWVVSNTNSSNFPVTSNALQSTLAGGLDGVLFQMDPTCTTLMYSTYLGGTGNDAIYNIGFNSDNNIVVCGGTQSSNFPTTPGSLHTTAPGGWDGFVSIINPSTSNLMYSTYLGTSGDDDASKLQVDCADNIYVLGNTFGNYPVTAAWSMPGADVYIDKLNPTLSTSLLSTRVGASQSGNYQRYLPTALLLDVCGDIYVAGLTPSTATAGLPVTPDAFDQAPKPFWFCILKPNFSDLLFGTYFGSGTSDHFHTGTSRFDPQGIVYQSVCSSDQTFPTTPGSWSPTKQNPSYSLDIVSFKFNFDATVIKMNELSTQGANDTTPHCVRGCKSAYFDFVRNTVDTVPMTVHYLIGGDASNGVDYQYIADSIVIPANDSMATLEIKPLLGPASGVKSVIISALSPCGCEDGSDNIVAVGKILIYDSLYVSINTPLDTVCSNTPITITADIDTTLNYEWQPAALIPDPIPLGLTIHPKPVHTTIYSITATQPGAPATCPPHTSYYTATAEEYPQIIMPARDTTVCINPNDSVNLNVYTLPEGVDYQYTWTPATYLRDNFSANNKFAAPVGNYSITIAATTPWAHCSNSDSMRIHVVPAFSFTSISPMDTTIKYGDKIKLDAEGSAIAWLWLPVTYMDDATLQSPTVRPLESMVYNVVGFDQYGCRDTGAVKINVEYDPNTFIPSAFSPNGDGKNDVFTIENMRFEKLLTFKVFNRLGQLVFESKNPKKGWDGNFNGKPAAMDTYFYVIEIVLPDGAHKTYKGDVALIR